MKTRTILLLAAALLAVSAFGVEKDKAGCKDPSLFPNRMPGYWIQDCQYQAYGFFEFSTAKPPKKRVEGEVTLVKYRVFEGTPERSGLEVVRNYENALRKIGAKIQGKDPNGDWWVNGTLLVDGKEVWAEAMKGNGLIWIRIVRTKEMDQIIVADAASFANDLTTMGHTAVEGIYFDTASAVLKPQSAAALTEIAKLLKADPALKVFVVGHTDTVGNLDANLKLSRDRAESVIQALTTQHGIAAARLKSFGNGPFAPVGSNATEDGRARNRRVELVKQ